MSVLVFVDESRWQRPGETDYFATAAGAAFEELSYDDFCRKLMRLKGRFFKRPGIGEYSLQGRLLLSPRSLNSFRKVEFIQELFSLCRLTKVTTFASTRRCSSLKQENAFADIPVQIHRSAISNSDRYSENVCSLLIAYLIERINSFMLESHPGTLAKLVFKTEEPKRDRILCASVMNFIFKTHFGGGFHGILGSPVFEPASHSPGVQVADLFAYIINQYHGGRREMKEFFHEVKSMQFVSSIQQDEFELKGMNLIE